jgi:glycosyltransferase involved in cell wall biosynthesis
MVDMRPVLVIGQSPPPYNGMSVATELVKRALNDEVPVIHLDTADRRSLANVGKLDFRNVLLAFVHGTKCVWILLSKSPGTVYVPISQAWLPFLRDCLFLIPARILGRKVVIHLHGGYFGRFYREAFPFMRWIIRYALGDASIAIVLGERVANAFDGILTRSRVRIVPNGIPDAFAGRTIKEPRQVSQAPTLLYLSTLMAGKGFQDLMRALPKVRERAGAVRAVFAGEWNSKQDEDMAHELTKSLSLAPFVEFVGPLGPGGKRKFLERADVFVFPTAYRFEGHPYVILEAMSAGLPIVSTHLACIPEMVRDGVEGFLIEPGDVSALAEKISCLLLDVDLRVRMGRASRERFLEQYTYDKFAERMRTALGEICRHNKDSISMLPMRGEHGDL